MNSSVLHMKRKIIMKYKVCIIGCGMIANSAHIPAYRAYDNLFEITAVCDNREEVACKTAKEHNIAKYCADLSQMLKAEKPDIVSVCTPNMLHEYGVRTALEYGAHVICEKPLSLSYNTAKSLFDYAKQCDRVLMTCQSLRFLPERLEANKMRVLGTIGDIYYAEASRIRRRGIPAWGAFHKKEVSGGGALIDIGVHLIDSAIWLMGNPTPVSVSAEMKKLHLDEFGSKKDSGALKNNVDTVDFKPDEINVETFASGSVKFSNDAVLTFKVAWTANMKEENNIILSGKNCGIDLENRKIYSGVNDITELKVCDNGFSSEPFYGHFCLVKNLADVLEGAAKPFIKPEETLNTTAILQAAYLSAELSREVKIEEIIGVK